MEKAPVACSRGFLFFRVSCVSGFCRDVERTMDQAHEPQHQGEDAPRVVKSGTEAQACDIERSLFGDAGDELFLEGLYPHTLDVFGREGWNDPAMNVYDGLDPRRNR